MHDELTTAPGIPGPSSRLLTNKPQVEASRQDTALDDGKAPLSVSRHDERCCWFMPP